jgi:hypothetical protein
MEERQRIVLRELQLAALRAGFFLFFVCLPDYTATH